MQSTAESADRCGECEWAFKAIVGMAWHYDAQGQGAKINHFTSIFYYYDYEDCDFG